MSSSSSIQWTDTTWNPVRGCSVISPGCINCYAMKMAHRFSGPGKPYEGLTTLTKAGPQWTGTIRLVDDALLQPLSWRKPRRVFVNSMSDLFHEDVPDAYIRDVADVMRRADWHTYQVLTKRSERMATLLASSLQRVAERDHIWWGVSVENRRHGFPRVDDLRRAPAAVKFLSVEPLLEDLGEIDLTGIHWVILGGESGPGARSCAMEWIADLVRQCAAANVPCFVKQLGRYPTQGGKAVKLTDHYKGDDPSEWPDDLRVREFPLTGTRHGEAA